MRLLLKSLLLIALLTGGAMVGHLFTFSVSNTDTVLDHPRHFHGGYKIFSLTLPGEVRFCGEKVPMEKLDVRERLDRELLVNTYWQSNSVLAHKRAARWFPVIEPVLAREGVPDDFKYLALIESALTNAVSPKGATGFWQFMKETAPAYGLEVNAEVDERYDVIKSSEAACRYLKEAHTRYGSWSMAAASYNLGFGGLDKQVGRQEVTDYWSLLLPEETSRYIARLIAMKEIIGDPERYGFHIRKKDLYAPYSTRSITITGPIDDITAFAQRQGTDYKTVKLLNPWLRDTKLSNTGGKTWTVLLPGEGFDAPNTDGDQ